MNERLNKTSICAVIFLDIVGYSKYTDAVQISKKRNFNRLISEAIKGVEQNDRILLDTGDGAAIALLGAPEEALFIAMTVRDCLNALNQKASEQLFVRIGINLGPVRVVKDISGRSNIIGDGINMAQRVMSFAEPNQILVSRSYYEITSRLSKEITELFTYSGMKHDKHVREHEVYTIGVSQQPGTGTAHPANEDGGTSELRGVAMLEKGNGWWSIGAALIVLIALTVTISRGTFVSGSAPEIMAKQAVPDTGITIENAEQLTIQGEAIAEEVLMQEMPMLDNPVQHSSQPQQGGIEHTKVQIVATNGSAKSNSAHKTEKSTWETFKESIKQGNASKACSVAERSLKQCE